MTRAGRIGWHQTTVNQLTLVSLVDQSAPVEPCAPLLTSDTTNANLATIFARVPQLFGILNLWFSIAFYLTVTVAVAQDEDRDGRWWDEATQAAIDRADENKGELVRALKQVAREHRSGMQFLITHMPDDDLPAIKASLLLDNVRQSYEVLKQVPWGSDIPHELFLNDILPYANVNERREEWRGPLSKICLPLVKDCRTPAEAAQRLNERLFAQIKVRYSTQRKKPHQSPGESMELGLASCTGLSILLVDACRSVGVPARLAGTPNWVDKRGNHTWVEIWDKGWHFTGAAEPDAKGLNRAWFVRDAAAARKDSPEHAIYAVSYRRTKLVFPLVWSPGHQGISAVNVTDRYTQHDATPVAAKPGTARLMIRVRAKESNRRVSSYVVVRD